MFPLHVITVTRNDLDGLNRTLSSLQGHPIRWSVVDGSERAGRRDVQRVAEQYGVQYLYEAPTGVYSAMNAGLKLVDPSDHIVFMNSGDLFHSRLRLDSLPFDHPWIIGSTEFRTERGTFLSIPSTDIKSISQGRDRICHQSMFMRADLLLAQGGFDERYRISADYNSWLMVASKVEPRSVNQVVSLVQLGGLSDVRCREMAREKRDIRRAHGFPTKKAFMVEELRCFVKNNLRRSDALAAVGDGFRSRYHERKNKNSGRSSGDHWGMMVGSSLSHEDDS